MNKQSNFQPSSVKNLLDTLKKSGTRIKSSDLNKVTKGSNGSMLYDIGQGLLKKGPKATKVLGKTVDKAYGRVRTSLIDGDMRAGSFLSDKLKNTRAKNLFTKGVNLEVRKPKNALGAREFIEAKMPSLLAPVVKAKDVVVPIAGSMAVANSLGKMSDAKKARDAEKKAQGQMNMEQIMSRQNGGDTMSTNKKAYSRDELMEKIASAINSSAMKGEVAGSPKATVGLEKKAIELMKKASESLGKANDRHIEDKLAIMKIAEENKQLKLTLMAKSRSDRSVKLAHELNEKGLIKKADIDNKIDEIMDMNDEAFEVLSGVVSNMEKESSEHEDDGVSSLTFIAGDGIFRQKSLASGINSLAKNY